MEISDASQLQSKSKIRQLEHLRLETCVSESLEMDPRDGITADNKSKRIIKNESSGNHFKNKNTLINSSISCIQDNEINITKKFSEHNTEFNNESIKRLNQSHKI